jgi:hypothetical protein
MAARALASDMIPRSSLLIDSNHPKEKKTVEQKNNPNARKSAQ